MLITTKELQQTLQELSVAVSAKEYVEQSSSFMFSNGTAYAFDGETVAYTSTNLDINGAVPAMKLMQVLDKAQEEVDVSVEGNTLVIKSGRGKSSINVVQDIKNPMPNVDEIEGEYEYTSQDGYSPVFIEQCRKASKFTTKSHHRPALQFVHVIPNHIEATDSFQAIQFQTEFKPHEEVLLSESAIKAIKNTTSMTITPSWLCFKKETGTTVCVRRVTGHYPNTDKIFNSPGTIITFPKYLKNVLERALILAPSDDPVVILQINNNKMIVFTESKSGSYEEETGCRFEFDATIQIHPKRLINVLQEDNMVEICENSTIRFSSPDYVFAALLPKQKQEST